jgi:hypothetical protein
MRAIFDDQDSAIGAAVTCTLEELRPYGVWREDIVDLGMSKWLVRPADSAMPKSRPLICTTSFGQAVRARGPNERRPLTLWFEPECPVATL